MAFIPDNSFDLRLAEKLSPTVWEFYQYLCRKRNHEERISYGTIDDFITKYGYKRASKFNLLKELKTSAWIGGEDGKYTLLVGDFTHVDKIADDRRIRRGQSKNLDSLENQSKNLDSESKKIDYQSKNLDSLIRNIPASLPADLPAINTQTGATFDFPLKELFAAFPDLKLQPGQAGFIQSTVKPEDKSAWLSTIEIYLQNYNPSTQSYLPEKVGNLLSVFKSQKAKLEKNNGKPGTYQTTGNGTRTERTNKPQNGNGETSPDFYSRYGADPKL